MRPAITTVTAVTAMMALVVLDVACIETPTSVALTFKRTGSTPELQALSITVWDATGRSQPPTRLPEQGALAAPDGDTLGSLVVFGTPAEDALRVDLLGLDATGAAVAEGVTVAALHAGRQGHADIVLAPGRLTDRDEDGVPDELDNCPRVANPLQEDWNENLHGDACDPPPALDAGTAGSGGKSSGTVVPVNAGEALLFDGINDHVPVPRRIWGDFTVELWLDTSCTGHGNTAWDGIGLVVNTAARATTTFTVSVLEGKLAFGVGAEGTSITSLSRVDTGSWTHVAVTRDGTTGVMRVVVNGVEEASGVGTTRPLVDAPTLYVGGSPGVSRMLCGTLDELRVWNVVRAPADIAHDRTRILTGAETGLVSYYRFDEGPGAIAAGDDAPKGGSSALGGDALGQQPIWVHSGAPLQP